jgi:hypothetical protein
MKADGSPVGTLMKSSKSLNTTNMRPCGGGSAAINSQW